MRRWDWDAFCEEWGEDIPHRLWVKGSVVDLSFPNGVRDQDPAENENDWFLSVIERFSLPISVFEAIRNREPDGVGC